MAKRINCIFSILKKKWKLWRKIEWIDWVPDVVIGKSRTIGDQFDHFPKISSTMGRGEENNFLMCFVAKWQMKHIYTLCFEVH